MFTFKSSEVRILNNLADAMVPPSEKIPERPSEVGIVQSVQGALQVCHPWLVLAFRSGLWWVQIRALFFRAKFQFFTQMNAHDRESFFTRFQASRFFLVVILRRLLEVFILSNFYSKEDVYRHLGYTLRVPDSTPSRDLYPGMVSQLTEDVEVETEVCVIGSGAGGAVVAKELAEAGRKVILLEEGGRFDLRDFYQEPIQRSQKMYRDGGITLALGIPPVLLPLGKTVGGTTVINSGTCFRTPNEVLKSWREDYGLVDLSEAEMEPYFEKVEKTLNVMEVPEALMGGSGRVIAQGLKKLSLPGAPLHRNIKGCQGSGLCCFGCPTDGKQSVQLNYIPLAVQAGAKLYARCKVMRLHYQKGQVSLVEARSVQEPHKSLRVRAKIVVLAAGSIGTPVLMMGSHLGNASGQLGRNLTIHPAAKTLALFEEKLEGWKGTPQSYYSDFLKGDGITLEGVFTPPALTSTSLLLHGSKNKSIMEQYDHLAAFGLIIREKARGRVRRLWDGNPLITYQLTQADFKTCIKGLVWLARIFFAAGAKSVYPCINSLPELKREADIEKFYSTGIKRKDLDLAAFHPLGTATMGIDPRRSVVNSFGQVHGMENLFIADGSIFPTHLGVNPQVSIMAFAARTARHIHEVLSHQ